MIEVLVQTGPNAYEQKRVRHEYANRIRVTETGALEVLQGTVVINAYAPGRWVETEKNT